MDASQNSSALLFQIRALQTQLQDLQTQLEALPPTPQHHQLVKSTSDLFQQLHTFAAENSTTHKPLTLAEAVLLRRSDLRPGLIDFLPVGVFITDVDGYSLYVNPHYQKILNCSLEDTLGSGWLNFVHPDDRAGMLSQWVTHAKEGSIHCTEYRVVIQGEIHWVRAQTTPVRDEQQTIVGHIGIIEDITQQKLADDRLKAALCEKEALLKEVHHRVKNNLQVISSLLYLQSHRIDDVRLRQFFDDSQNRISSMALVHDTLYRSQDFAQINLSEYVQTLTTHLFQTYRIQPELVKLNLEIDDDVMVEIDQAIPCGLILNELITNALKHGFSSGQNGHITVTLRNFSDRVCLVVENNGNPLPEDFELEKSRSMGLRLVNSLVHQLQGQVQVEKTHKTYFKVTFKRI